MALTIEQQAALANERRWNELKRKEAGLLEGSRYAGHVAEAAANLQNSAAEQLRAIRDELAALENGAGPGLAEDLGFYSELERAARAERAAGKSAVIGAAKADPELTLEAALAAYREAASSPDREYVLFDPASLLRFYAERAVELGLILDASWENFRALLTATPEDELMTM